MGLHSHNDADDRRPPKISNSGLSPFVCPQLYQPAYGKVLATIFATRRQAGHEPRRKDKKLVSGLLEVCCQLNLFL